MWFYCDLFIYYYVLIIIMSLSTMNYVYRQTIKNEDRTLTIQQSNYFCFRPGTKFLKLNLNWEYVFNFYN